jgi:protein-S-isoprenylcysteine O-methyltransferase Ste14
MRRRIAAAAALPVIVTLVVPAGTLVLQSRLGWRVSLSPIPGLVLGGLGVVLILAGLTLMAWTISLFRRLGRGTLAPWDPPTRLVIAGPYAHVRNPMISGVFAVLLGEALIFGSPLMAAWFVLFAGNNLVWVRLWEERDLTRRFGDEYRDYARHVPRWLPRLRPWRPPRASSPVRRARSDRPGSPGP